MAASYLCAPLWAHRPRHCPLGGGRGSLTKNLSERAGGGGHGKSQVDTFFRGEGMGVHVMGG